MPDDAPPTEQASVRLDQFLKLNFITDTGGQAKLLIQGGDVCVNGETEIRRRRKLLSGDVVEVGGETWQVADFFDRDSTTTG